MGQPGTAHPGVECEPEPDFVRGFNADRRQDRRAERGRTRVRRLWAGTGARCSGAASAWIGIQLSDAWRPGSGRAAGGDSQRTRGEPGGAVEPGTQSVDAGSGGGRGFHAGAARGGSDAGGAASSAAGTDGPPGAADAAAAHANHAAAALAATATIATTAESAAAATAAVE